MMVYQTGPSILTKRTLDSAFFAIENGAVQRPSCFLGGTARTSSLFATNSHETTQWALHVSMDWCLRLFFKHFKAFQDSHWTAPKGSCRNSMTQVVDSWPQQFLGHMSRYVQSFLHLCSLLNHFQVGSLGKIT